MGANWTLHPWHHNSSNVGGVTAGQARHNTSNVGGVTAGQVRHNSSLYTEHWLSVFDETNAMWWSASSIEIVTYRPSWRCSRVTSSARRRELQTDTKRPGNCRLRDRHCRSI